MLKEIFSHKIFERDWKCINYYWFLIELFNTTHFNIQNHKKFSSHMAKSYRVIRMLIFFFFFFYYSKLLVSHSARIIEKIRKNRLLFYPQIKIYLTVNEKILYLIPFYSHSIAEQFNIRLKKIYFWTFAPN